MLAQSGARSEASTLGESIRRGAISLRVTTRRSRSSFSWPLACWATIARPMLSTIFANTTAARGWLRTVVEKGPPIRHRYAQRRSTDLQCANALQTTNGTHAAPHELQVRTCLQHTDVAPGDVE